MKLFFNVKEWFLSYIKVYDMWNGKSYMVRSMREVKLVNRKNDEELKEMLGLKETFENAAKANRVRCYGNVVRRKDNNVVKRALMLEVNEQGKRGRPRQTWKRQQVEENVKKIGLKVEEAADRIRWRQVVRAIAGGMSDRWGNDVPTSFTV